MEIYSLLILISNHVWTSCVCWSVSASAFSQRSRYFLEPACFWNSLHVTEWRCQPPSPEVGNPGIILFPPSRVGHALSVSTPFEWFMKWLSNSVSPTFILISTAYCSPLHLLPDFLKWPSTLCSRSLMPLQPSYEDMNLNLGLLIHYSINSLIAWACGLSGYHSL